MVVNVAEYTAKRQLSAVSTRIPQHLKERAVRMAREQSSDTIQVKPSDVYRMAIEFFFDTMDTEWSDKTLENGGELTQP